MIELISVIASLLVTSLLCVSQAVIIFQQNKEADKRRKITDSQYEEMERLLRRCLADSIQKRGETNAQ